MTKNKHTPKTKWWLSVISTLVNVPLPMPMITKAATPLRMPRYLTPNTTWYKKRAMRQLSPMLASPKKVRNTVNRKQGHLSALGQLYCTKINRKEATRTNEAQVLPEKEVRTKTSSVMQAPLMTANIMSLWNVCLTSLSNSSVPPYRTFTWLEQRREERDRDVTSAPETVVDTVDCSGWEDFRASNWWGASDYGGLNLTWSAQPATDIKAEPAGQPDLVDCLARTSAYCTTKSLKRARCSSARSCRE